MIAQPAPSLPLLLAAVLLCAAGTVAPARATAQPDDDLGDTGAPPPTAEDLGRVPPEPPEAPAGAQPRRPARDAAVNAPAMGVTAAAPTPEALAKAVKLADELRVALAKEPGEARALDALVSWAPGESVLAATPELKSLLKLARVRALLLHGRLDEANSAVNEARSLIDAVGGRPHKSLVAQLRYRQAELEEARAKPPACASLGLRRVAAVEGKLARTRAEQVAAKYRHAIVADGRFWSRRAAFRIAVVYDDFYRKALAPPSTYRGVPLPAPLSLARVDTKAVTAGVLGGAWPAEISRLYAEVIASIDAREPDATLLEQARERAAAFARLALPEGEIANNPWLADEKPGLVRHHQGWQRKQPSGAWLAIAEAEGKSAAHAALQQPLSSIDHAYALVALVAAGVEVAPEVVLEALGAAEPRVTLAGLLAAEGEPDVLFLDVLVSIATEPQQGAPFSTLQGALYGTRERALLALRALANEDRAASEKLLADARLPARERTWIIAELGESRLQYALQGMIADRDPQAGATALYALLVAVGNKASGYLRTYDQGPIGCVSRALEQTK